jgi:glutamate N-acetyltransferase/amino-acid N-acetyltransferase
MPWQAELMRTKEVSAPVLAGVQLGSAAARIRYQDRDDLVIMELAPGSTCAGVFTRNAFCAAPVHIAREHLGVVNPRLLLINSGNANAGTGSRGLQDARDSCAMAAAVLGASNEQVLPFSTGVIGEFLSMEKVGKGIDAAYQDLRPDGWQRAARAIMTTDTRPKLSRRTVELGDSTVTIMGMAKGSGMVCPDMATMLAFLATDASIEVGFLRDCLQRAVVVSFNAITVDGDTSTNDACVLAATGQVDNPNPSKDQEAGQKFFGALVALCEDLALELVRDAEGGTKLITVAVEQGASVEECRQVAYTVAHSPLVKTAFFASDANWGRILAAVGRAGLKDLELQRVEVFLGDVKIVSAGGRDPGYTEEQGQEVMQAPEIKVRICLGRGESRAQVWTSDLSHDYVTINADYRT